MKIGILNGPNLNLIGTREQEIYGSQSFDDYLSTLRQEFKEHEIEYFQGNGEGVLIDKLQEMAQSSAAILLNPGAFTHTSIAMGDAVASVQIPVYEVHISNIFRRENYRKHSYISAKAEAVISGLGLKGYEMAIRAILTKANAGP